MQFTLRQKIVPINVELFCKYFNVLFYKGGKVVIEKKDVLFLFQVVGVLLFGFLGSGNYTCRK